MFIGVLRVVEGLRRLRSAIGRQKAPQQTEQILSKRQERTLVPAHGCRRNSKEDGFLASTRIFRVSGNFADLVSPETLREAPDFSRGSRSVRRA